ncbi:MAG: site-specific tyrosine recombinase XerD [Chitinophagales bacterium]|nr:site-specific tyrosine recombinase XerD [Chitinophagales bacterium]
MHWPAAIEQFHAWLLLERGNSPNTIAAYLNDVHKLVQYFELQGREISPLAVSRSDLENFIHWINDLGLEAGTQARIISGIRAFYKFLLVDDLLDEDPTELLDGPRLRRKLPEVLSISEVKSLLEGNDLSDPLGVRNRAMLEVLYACGLRVSELVGLRLSNLFPDAGFIRVIGKNDKERLVPISPDAVRYLRMYLDHHRPEKIKPGAENVVFLNRRGAPLTRVMVFYIIKELAEQAGILKNISPHTFRHAFATHLVEGGADLKAVQDMLGHESITTTEIYTHLDTDYLRETILMYHPRLKWTRGEP